MITFDDAPRMLIFKDLGYASEKVEWNGIVIGPASNLFFMISRVSSKLCNYESRLKNQIYYFMKKEANFKFW